MALYNTTNLTGNVLELTQGANQISGGWVGLLFLIGIVLVIVIPAVIRQEGILKSSVAAFFVTAVLSTLLASVGLVEGWVIIAFVTLLILVGSVLYLGGVK